MTWPLPNSDADVPSTDVSSGTAAGAPASARTSIFGPLITRFNTLKALVNAIINNGQPLTLNGSESATAFVNAAFGVKAGNTSRSDVNTIDWYQEGTFTPVLDFGGSTAGITGAANLGVYTRIGNMVFYHMDIWITNRGTTGGTYPARLTGFPFSMSSTHQQPLGSGRQTAYGLGVAGSLGGQMDMTANCMYMFLTSQTNYQVTYATFSPTYNTFSLSGWYWAA